MVRNVAPLMRELERQDFYLLSGIEHGMRFSEWVNRQKLPGFADLDPEEVGYRIDRCMDHGLIERRTIQYEGYKLRFEGYDALALHTFAERGTITGVGAPLGEGKESDVWEVTNGEVLALKFHREGVTNFREVHRARDYTADRHHVSWMYTARKAAEREYESLSAVHGMATVPRPVDHNRHAVVMERIDGTPLARADLSTDRARAVLESILGELAGTYDAGYVHTDASAYNVVVRTDDVVLIDWPQAIPVDHPNAEEHLLRDVENVLGHFQQKHPGLLREDWNARAITRRVAGDEPRQWDSLFD